MSKNTFGVYKFDDWVPKDVRESIIDFWGCMGRTYKDWLQNSQQNAREFCTHIRCAGFGNPQLGEWVCYHLRDGSFVIGRYIHAWNNIGRLIDESGKVHYP